MRLGVSVWVPWALETTCVAGGFGASVSDLLARATLQCLGSRKIESAPMGELSVGCGVCLVGQLAVSQEYALHSGGVFSAFETLTKWL